MRVARPVRLTPEQQKQLEAAAEGRRVSVRLAERASIVLLAAHSRAKARIVLAGMLLSSAAHSGVLGTPSSSPRTFFLNSSNPIVLSLTYCLS